MRIIAGQNRGLRLAEIGAGDPAAHLRPTTDRVRETLFNVLRNWINFYWALPFRCGPFV